MAYGWIRVNLGMLNSAVTTLALGLAHPQPPDKVSGWLRVGVKKFSKENDVYEAATIVIERNHCFKSTCLTFKPVSQSSGDSHTFITSHQNLVRLPLSCLPKFCCDDPRLQCGLLSKGVCKAGLSPPLSTPWPGLHAKLDQIPAQSMLSRRHPQFSKWSI